MGRNDMCFCGSGKKTKKCHPDINKNSLGARIIKSHNTIDKIILDHQNDTDKNSKCHIGCAECCYHYFTITDCEFFLILNEVQKWNDVEKDKLSTKTKEYMKIFEHEHPEVLNFLKKDRTGNQKLLSEYNNIIDETSFPCVFLDEETQKCLVYDVRPSICRTHGNVGGPTNDIVCSKIGKYKDADYLINMEFEIGDEHDYGYIKISETEVFRIAQYPIFYHLHFNLFVAKLDFKIFPPLDLSYFSISEDEYIRRIKTSILYR